MSAMFILQPEASIWYVIVWLVVGARFASKRMRLGSWRNLQIDDYLVMLAMLTLTILFGLLHIIINTNSNLIPPGEDVSKWGPEQIREREFGSKLTIVVEQMQISTTWLLKACLLILYSRMTELLRLRVVVKIAAVYVGIGFLVMEILWFGVWCRPFNQYWAVPPNSTQCSAMVNHLIANAVLNISSDLLIMAIPAPLVFKVKIPLRNKLILAGMFFVGFFTIFAAAKNKYESFMHLFSTNWIIWYLREAFTAMLCANLPLTRPVLQRLFKLGDWTHAMSTSHRYDNGYNSRSQFPGSFHLRSTSTPGNETIISSGPTKPLPVAPSYGSEEYINEIAPLEITYEREITIERHPMDADESSVMEMGKADQPEYPSPETVNLDTISTKSRLGSIVTMCYHHSNEEIRRF